MLWLPYFGTLSDQPPVAVADRSAAALEQALLESQPAAAAAHLQAGLLLDPWFCRWLRAWVPEVHQSVARLAAEFVSRLDQIFSVVDPVQLETIGNRHGWLRPSDQQARQLATQAAAVLVVAERHRGPGGDHGRSPEFLATVLAVGQTEGEEAPPSADYLLHFPGVEWRLPRLVALRAQLARFEKRFARQLQQAKLDAMKELAYGASHEVNNPLANISGRAQALLRDETDHRKRRLLAAIDTQALRAHEMISDLMLFARPPALVRQPTEIEALATKAVDELRPMAEQRHVELVLQAPPAPVLIDVDDTQCTVAIKALVQNGMEAVGHHGQVAVAWQGEPRQAVIRVSDTGAGLAEDAGQHLFDPFYSGREAGRGLGFGLSKCWRIASDHGGSLHVESSGPSGTTFALRLPLANLATSTAGG